MKVAIALINKVHFWTRDGHTLTVLLAIDMMFGIRNGFAFIHVLAYYINYKII